MNKLTFFLCLFLLGFFSHSQSATKSPANYLTCESGLPSNQNSLAAVKIPKYGIYIFKGNKYYKYKIINNKRVLQAGYPKNMPGGWRKLPKSFQNGIDAAVYYPPTQKTYFFKGNQYVRLTGITVDKGFPKRLPGNWSGLPSNFSKNIDAAIYFKGEKEQNGQIVLVKGKKYISFENFKIKVPDGNITDLWPNIPFPFKNEISALLPKSVFDNTRYGDFAVTWMFSNFNYIAAPNKKSNSSSNTNLSVEPKKLPPVNARNLGKTQVNFSTLWGKIGELSDWGIQKYDLGRPDFSKISADAGIEIPGMGRYLFVGNKYYKYKTDKSIDPHYHQPPKLWSKYPKLLPGGWLKLPKAFQSGIDAAFYNPQSKKSYFFKGNQYIRLTGRKVDKGYPIKLPKNWPGLPPAFQSDIDAAFTISEGRKLFVILIKNRSFVAFYKGKMYTTGRTKDLWKGLPKGYSGEIQAIIPNGTAGNYLFCGEQCRFAYGSSISTAPNFTIPNAIHNRFKEAELVEVWNIPSRNRPLMSKISGSNNGINVTVGAGIGKSHKKEKVDKPKTDDQYECVTKHIDEKVVSPENILLDPTTDVIWLGAIVDGNSIPTGEYKLLSYPRHSFKISTSTSAAAIGSAVITEPLSNSFVRKKVKQIIKSINKFPSEKMVFEKEEIENEKQFRLKFSGHYNTGVVKVSAGLDLKRKSKQHRLVVNFVEECFSIDMDDVKNYKQWIVKPQNVDFYSTIPMYIASIKYGRRAYLSIESEESLKSLETYFSGAYAGAGVKLNYDQSQLLKKSKVKVYIVGGNGKNALKGITGDYKAFIKYINTPIKSAEEIKPLSYTMRFLKDNTVAKVSLSSVYTVRNCTPYQFKWKTKIKSLKILEGGPQDMYGTIWLAIFDGKGNMLKEIRAWDPDHDEAITVGSGGINVNHGFRYQFKNKKQLKGAYVQVHAKLTEQHTLGNNYFKDTFSPKIYLNEITESKPEIPLDIYYGDVHAQVTFSVEIQ